MVRTRKPKIISLKSKRKDHDVNFNNKKTSAKKPKIISLASKKKDPKEKDPKIISLSKKKDPKEKDPKIISLSKNKKTKTVSLVSKKKKSQIISLVSKKKKSKIISLVSKKKNSRMVSLKSGKKSNDSDIDEDYDDYGINERLQSIEEEQRKLELVQKELMDLDEQLNEYKYPEKKASKSRLISLAPKKKKSKLISLAPKKKKSRVVSLAPKLKKTAVNNAERKKRFSGQPKMVSLVPQRKNNGTPAKRKNHVLSQKRKNHVISQKRKNHVPISYPVTKNINDWNEDQVWQWLSSKIYSTKLSQTQFEFIDGATLVDLDYESAAALQIPTRLIPRILKDVKAESDNPEFKFNRTEQKVSSTIQPKVISLTSKRNSFTSKRKQQGTRKISLAPKRKQHVSLAPKRKQHVTLVSKRKQHDSDINEDDEDYGIDERLRSIEAEQRKLELVQKELTDLDEQLSQYNEPEPQTSNKLKKRAVLAKRKFKKRPVLTKAKKVKKYNHSSTNVRRGSKFTVTFNED